MSVPTAEILAAAGMMVTALVLVFAYRGYLLRGSERRMQSMLESVGLDLELVTSGDLETIMEDVRYRCRQCSSEAACERWLAGEEGGDNDFCPNQRVFEILRKYSGT